jgi:two-component system, NarL family, sensor kinase
MMRVNNRLRNLSLAQKQAFYFMAVAILITTILSTYFYYYSRNAINNRTFDQLTAVRETKKNQLEYLLSEHILHLGALANLMTNGMPVAASTQKNITEPKEVPLNELIIREYHHIANVHSIGIKELAQRVQFRTADIFSQGRYFRDVEMYNQVMAGETMFVNDYLFPDTSYEAPVLSVGFLKIKVLGESPDTTLIWFELSSKVLTDAMMEYSKEKGFGHSAEAYLVGADHRLRSPSRFMDEAILNVENNSSAVKRAIEGHSGTMVTHDYRNIRVCSSYAPLEFYGLKWAILSEIDYEEAMRPINAMRNDILFLSFVILLLSLSVSVFLASTLVRPIKRLEKAVRFFGAGEAPIQVTQTTKDEIGALTRTFNEMAGELNRKTAAIFCEQEKERQRIARELHDGLGQIMAGIKIKMEHFSNTTDTKSRGLLDDTKAHLTQAIDELHRISNNLRPAVLSELGLADALRNLSRQFSQTTEIACDLSTEGDFSDLSPEASNYLFRICQEGLANVAKHAEAGWVQIHAIASADQYLIMVEDNGQGMPKDLPQMHGNGLFNMRERAMLLHGKITIESAENQGTTLRIKIPRIGNTIISNNSIS